MAQFTLNDFYNRVDYLTEKGTLEELLAFLELEKAGGTDGRDVFNIANTDFMAFEVLLDEAKVLFQLNSIKEDEEEKVTNLFLVLFQDHIVLLKRLCELLSEEYSHLGSLSFETKSISYLSPFRVKLGHGGYYITHNPDKF